ncbi:MAG TPA: glycine betaine ABC transporter substrate-binding protein [Thermomicrobiales bacterium]|nr:glycine betaine ABC transporter substrate-binding protein [Thermomicrobiales bacterium]
MRRIGSFIIGLALLALVMPAVTALAQTTGTPATGTPAASPVPNPEAAGKITIGSKLDVDGQLNAQMYALLLESKGYDVSTKLALGQTPVLDKAIKSGDLDIYPEFTGTALSLLKLPPTQDAKQAYEQVKDAYEKQFQLTWLDPAYGLNDSYAICTSKDVADKYQLTSLDDLAKVGGDLTIAAQQDGIEAAVDPVEKGYGFTFKDVVQISEQLSFGAVEKGDVDLNVCYTTDPNIIVKDFVVLKDTKNVFPIYNPAPVVRDELLQKDPAIASILNQLQPHLTTDKMLDLIKQVSVDHKEIKDVAKSFLENEGLLPKD